MAASPHRLNHPLPALTCRAGELVSVSSISAGIFELRDVAFRCVDALEDSSRTDTDAVATRMHEVTLSLAEMVSGLRTANRVKGTRAKRNPAISGHRREFFIWSQLIQRCTNPALTQWNYYGGRGVKVSSRWRHSFSNFLADMGPRPSSCHSIDRIDTDGHYEADNCCWSTVLEQASHRRRRGALTMSPATLPLQVSQSPRLSARSCREAAHASHAVNAAHLYRADPRKL